MFGSFIALSLVSLGYAKEERVEGRSSAQIMNNAESTYLRVGITGASAEVMHHLALLKGERHFQGELTLFVLKDWQCGQIPETNEFFCVQDIHF